MVIGLLELLLVALVLGGLLFGGWAAWRALQRDAPAPPRLTARERGWLAEQISRARWVPAHDEVDGTTRILLRRSYTGLDGRPAVLEERVFDSFPAHDPAWEARFTEAMSNARFRCAYLNAEESQ